MGTKEETIVTRFPPSPTGSLQTGNIRTGLFNFLFARKHNGTFILRSEDTDKERSKQEYEDAIKEDLAWLGLAYDAFYRQSDNIESHKKHLDNLLNKEIAYLSKEESKMNPGTEVEVVRLKNPGKEVTFTDLVRGEVTFDTTELGDFVIARNINDPLYHFAVVVDDAEEGITHVIRGEDHISNTPRQILIQEALGFERPKYAHIPLILASDRSKLSKRKGSVSLAEYREKGYLPEALINYLALLGWNPGTDQELFTLPELIKEFDLSGIQKGGAIFDIEKLNWINGEYIKKMDRPARTSQIQSFIPESVTKLKGYSKEQLEKIEPVITERIRTFGEVITLAESGELDYYFEAPKYDVGKLPWKEDDEKIAREHLLRVVEKLTEVQNDTFTKETVKEILWNYAETSGKGSVLWPIRYALSGKQKSPDPFILAELLGKNETLARLSKAIELLSHASSVS